MSDFRTILPLQKSSLSIDYQSPLLCIGSCFTQHIGQRLSDYKFPTLLNPFGILYNPLSIKNSLDFLLAEKTYTAEDLFFHQDLWHSFDHHGTFSSPDQSSILTQINTRLKTAQLFLKKTKVLMLTFGTSNVFIKKSTRKVVANCHKIPNTAFEKKRLTIAEITEVFTPVLEKLKLINPDLKVIFTVSPVRHLKDGLIENQRSKATLLLAIEALTQELSFTHYFPAYELVQDDLRDYRFFEKDMAHPNELAIEYIWKAFQSTYFSHSTDVIFKQVKKIVQASLHRPFHPQTNTHQQFVRKQLEKIELLTQKYSFLEFKKEQHLFKSQLPNNHS